MDESQDRKRKRRREQGEGSLFRYPNCQRWVIQYYVDGKRKREATGLLHRVDALKVLRDRLSAIGKGELFQPVRPPRLSELYDTMRAFYKTEGKDVRELDRRWKHLEPMFGIMLAARLTSDAINGYILHRQTEGRANATINRELACLRRMLRLAHRETPPRVTVVPHIPMLPENNARRNFVDDRKFSDLMAAAKEPWLRLYLELAYSYAWRRGELLGLQLRNVNVLENTIRLDPGTTKNKEGREVVMTVRVREKVIAAMIGKKDEDYLLTRENGRRVKNFRKAWYSLCVRAGLSHYKCRRCGKTRTETTKCPSCGHRKWTHVGQFVHDLRRSAAVAMRRAGIPESLIMDTGGWKTASMFRRYAIVDREARKTVAERIQAGRTEGDLKVALIGLQTEGQPENEAQRKPS